MLEEQWVVNDLLDLYEVSNYGRIFDLEENRELIPFADPETGELRVTLFFNDKPFRVLVKKLVASGYFLNYTSTSKISHINGNLEDNSVLNLTLGPVHGVP